MSAILKYEVEEDDPVPAARSLIHLEKIVKTYDSGENEVQAAAPEPQQAERPNPMLREYDQYGNELRRAPAPGPAAANSGAAGSPIYLIAFKDHAIHAVAAYWVDGNTLHYVTLERQEHQVSLDSVDRAMSEQLNRERRVQFSLAAR